MTKKNLYLPDQDQADLGNMDTMGAGWQSSFIDQSEQTVQSNAPASQNRVRPCLLVVDDQNTNVAILQQIFAKEHDILTANSGSEALKICQREHPDLVLLDVLMPEMDGYTTCQKIKANPETADIPVIFVTAQDSSFDEAHAFTMGGADFISKPVSPAVVRARVRAQLTIKAQADLLRRLAFVDGLTGIANRRQFDESLQAAWSDTKRRHEPLGLIMIDVDHFKLYNDTYGHERGDACLQAVADALKSTMKRGLDLVARFGGEEFAVLLPNTNLEGVLSIAEDCRRSVEALQIPHRSSSTAKTITISLGAAVLVPSQQTAAEELLKTADKQLYAAKQNGRNRVAASAE